MLLQFEVLYFIFTYEESNYFDWDSYQDGLPKIFYNKYKFVKLDLDISNYL